MQMKNSTTRFGIVAVAFHWVMALLVIGMLAIGLYMVRLPQGVEKLTFYGWHKECGFLVLMLAALRLIWRLNNQTPDLLLPRLEKIAARSMHWALYCFMFAMPVTGWLMSSAAGFPISFFGLFIVPDLISPNEHMRDLLGEIHETLAYILIGAVSVHIAAALKHHLVNKDDILRRILP